MSMDEGSGLIEGYVHAAVGPGMGKNAALVALKFGRWVGGWLGGTKTAILLFVLVLLFSRHNRRYLLHFVVVSNFMLVFYDTASYRRKKVRCERPNRAKTESSASKIRCHIVAWPRKKK